MTTKKLIMKMTDGMIERQLKEFDMSIDQADLIKEYFLEDQREEGIENIQCTCEWGTLHPDNFSLGEKVCNHIELYLKLPQLFE